MDFLDASRNRREAERRCQRKELRRAWTIALVSAQWIRTERQRAEQASQERTKKLFESDLTHAALLARGKDRRILHWSVPDWAIQRQWQAPNRVFSLALSPDDNTLASGDRGKHITL